MKLSTDEIAYLVLHAGFSENSEAAIMVAIIMATSNGESDYLEFIEIEGKQDQLHGLSAMSSVHHHDQLLMGNWRDPETNVNMAYSLFTATGRSFVNWEAFTTNAHKAFLPLAYYGVENPVKPLSNASLKADENGEMLNEILIHLEALNRHNVAIRDTVTAINGALLTFGKSLSEIRAFFRN